MKPARETWRAVPGFEGYYDISNLGRLRVLQRGGKPRHPWVMKVHPRGPYLRIVLVRGGTKTARDVHQLVLLAFRGPCPPGLEGAHRNGCGTDNRLSNLKYKTSKANNADRKRHGTLACGERHGMAKLTAAAVRASRAACVPGDPERGFSAWARKLGVDRHTMRKAICGEAWAHV